MKVNKYCLPHKLLLLQVFSFAFSLSLFAQEAKLMLPVGHTSAVFDAAFSPDGKRVVTASQDKTAKIWDVTTGDLLADLKGNKQFVMAVEYSPDGKMIVTAGFDGTAKIWDANSALLLHSLVGHRDTVNIAHFSSDGKKIVTCSRDSTAKIWDVATGSLLKTFYGHTQLMATVCFNKDATKVLTASYDGTARIWDAATGKEIKRFDESGDTINSAKFSPDEKYVITACKRGVANIWNVETQTIEKVLRGHRANVYTATFSPNGKYIATTSKDSTAIIWNANTGRSIRVIHHQNEVWSAAFNGDGEKLITASKDNTAKEWDILHDKLIAQLKGHTGSVEKAQFSPDGNKIVTASFDKTARIWDSRNGELLKDLKGYTSGLFSVSVSKDGSKIITPSGDNSIKIWDIKKTGIAYELKGHTDTVWNAIFSPDNKKIVSVSSDKTARLWDAYNGDSLATLTGHTQKIKLVKYSNNGQYIVTGSDDSTAIIWDGESGALLHKCTGHIGGIRSVQFSNDGNKMVTASRDGTAKIWETATGQLLFTLEGHKGPVMTAEFNPDGSRVVTASRDGTAKIWDALTGKPIIDLPGDLGTVSSAKYNYDGTKIVTAYEKANIKIWDGQGNFLKYLRGHSFNLRSAYFTKDGKKIISVSRDNTAKIWDAETGDILHEFRDSIGEVESADLTPDESNLVIASARAAVSVWDVQHDELLYTFFTVGGSDYLVFDKDGHYDGTDRAKNMLYYTCGTELVTLKQVQANLYVPLLVESIMEGKPIEQPTLKEADICGNVPVIEKIDGGVNFYHYKIKPGYGGLGQTEVLINGNPKRKYEREQLTKVGDYYELKIPVKELQPHFLSGQENTVTLRAYTINNKYTSRGFDFHSQSDNKKAPAPNLFIVMIGVSDYKGTGLDLNYADKDAEDLSYTLSLAAKNMLDSPGAKHVFTYNLTTGSNPYQLPEKKNIINVLREIGKKATKYDYLILFFAGHGIIDKGARDTFYFLTSDASKENFRTSLKDVGISAYELASWLHIDNMKIQKRSLIFDACNSEQALTDFILSMNSLKDSTGDMINLCSSAADQSAYELTKYRHGLLTYALLTSIWQSPDNDMLEEGFLNIGGWYSEAQKVVRKLKKKNELLQEAGTFGVKTFEAGIVDNQVIASINLSTDNLLFANSRFSNNKDKDEIELSKYVNSQLHDIASRGDTVTTINYTNGSSAPDAWLISGSYIINANSLQVNIQVQQNRDSNAKYIFPVSGTKDKIKDLAGAIVRQATEWIKKQEL